MSGGWCATPNSEPRTGSCWANCGTRWSARRTSGNCTLTFGKLDATYWGGYTASKRDSGGQTEITGGRYQFQDSRMSNNLAEPGYAADTLVLESENEFYRLVQLAGSGESKLVNRQWHHRLFRLGCRRRTHS